MTMIRYYSPELVTSRRYNRPEYNELLKSFVNAASCMASENRTIPAVNIIEEPERYRIEVAAPGYEKKDFDVSIDNDVLKIKAQREIKEVEGECFTRCEYAYGDFERNFMVGKTIDSGRIEAQYKDGILIVYLHKREEAKPQKPRTIDIN
jgi:HSP20 family protein